MQIHIKKLDGQKEEFSLEPNDSVMKVKVSGIGKGRRRLGSMTAMSGAQQRWTLRRELPAPLHRSRAHMLTGRAMLSRTLDHRACCLNCRRCSQRRPVCTRQVSLVSALATLAAALC